MQDETPLMLVVSDSRKASLFTGTIARSEDAALPKVRVALAGILESPWRDFHEHGRPSALGQGPSANASQHFAGTGHEEEEMERRFAHQVAAWIASRAAAAPEAVAVAFAGPRFLGHLRAAIASTGCDIRLERGDLGWLRPAELGAHPAVRAACAAAMPRAVPASRG
jgi:protein required for attachment to host cells